MRLKLSVQSFEPVLVIHIRHALAKGARRDEILEVFHLASLTGLQGYVAGARALHVLAVLPLRHPLAEPARALRGCYGHGALRAPPIPKSRPRCTTFNRTFHAIINDAAGNPGALPIVDNHWLLVSVMLKRYGQSELRFQRVIDEHSHLIHAIEHRDSHSAAVFMSAHIEQSKINMMQRAALASQDKSEAA